MTTTAISPEQLKANIISVRDKLVEGLKAAGLIVETIDNFVSVKWPTSALLVTSSKLDKKAWEQLIRVNTLEARNGEPNAVGFTIINKGRSSRDRKYTKLNDDTYKKAVEIVLDTERLVVQTAESRALADADRKKWEGVRHEQLKGTVIPPGLSVDITMGNGPHAGQYIARFQQYGFNLAHVPLTVDKVKRLITVVNEIMEIDKYSVIVAAAPANGLHEGRVMVWMAADDWYHSNPVDGKLVTPENSEAELAKATAKAGNTWKVKVVPYRELAAV
jgi:hypothetical protein